MMDSIQNQYNHLTFMFAAPLAIHNQDNDEYFEIDQLDCAGEWERLKKSMQNHKKKIKLRKICGT
jgi:hypothetical protein